jgi:hypothetical protein
VAKENGRIFSPAFIGFSSGKGKWKNFEPWFNRLRVLAKDNPCSPSAKPTAFLNNSALGQSVFEIR